MKKDFKIYLEVKVEDGSKSITSRILYILNAFIKADQT